MRLARIGNYEVQDKLSAAAFQTKKNQGLLPCGSYLNRKNHELQPSSRFLHLHLFTRIGPEEWEVGSRYLLPFSSNWFFRP